MVFCRTAIPYKTNCNIYNNVCSNVYLTIYCFTKIVFSNFVLFIYFLFFFFGTLCIEECQFMRFGLDASRILTFIKFICYLNHHFSTIHTLFDHCCEFWWYIIAYFLFFLLYKVSTMVYKWSNWKLCCIFVCDFDVKWQHDALYIQYMFYFCLFVPVLSHFFVVLSFDFCIHIQSHFVFVVFIMVIPSQCVFFNLCLSWHYESKMNILSH